MYVIIVLGHPCMLTPIKLNIRFQLVCSFCKMWCI